MALFFTVLVLSYLYHGFGITLGYHRLLSHRSFRVPVWLEYLIVSGGYLCFEGSPISWVATHRIHHRYSDQVGDPHSPRDGLWHAFIGWMPRRSVKLTIAQLREICPDLYRHRLYDWLEFGHTRRHALFCLVCCIVLRVAILVALGPVALAANLLASLGAFVSPLLVNSICHMPGTGYRNAPVNDQSRNVWWVALLSLGEGWHNNHHASPQSARHGVRLHEIDLSWWAIIAMKVLGLASNIRLPRPKEPVYAEVLVDEVESLSECTPVR